MKTALSLCLIVAITWSGLWFTEDQQAQRFFNQGKYKQAAETYQDPMHRGVAWFKAGEFEKAEKAFSQIGTPEGHYNRGNALMMRGKYEQAIKSFDKAIKEKADFSAAIHNRKIAIARAKLTERKGGDMGDQKLGADEIRFDKNQPNQGQDTETESQQTLSEAEMQALWLRRVQTKPADFLKAKFSFQLNNEDEGETE